MQWQRLLQIPTLKKNNKEHHIKAKKMKTPILTCGLYLFLLGGNELNRMKKPSVIYPFINEQSPFVRVCFCPFFLKRDVVTFEVISQLFCSSDFFPCTRQERKVVVREYACIGGICGERRNTVSSL